MINWISIISVLYLPPIILILSYRHKNKHKYIYSSIYLVIVSTIIILSLYSNKSIATNKIKINENVKVKNNKYIAEKQEKTHIKEEYNQNIEEDKKEDILIEEENNDEKIIEGERKYKVNNEEEITIVEDNVQNEEENKKDELEIYKEFREEITAIEKEALVPLRNCYSLLKKMKKGESNITELREEAKNAKEKCKLVEKKYMNLKVPNLKDKENVDLLKDGKLDLQKAFYIRGKAMENGIKFLDTKNPKYILKIKEELKTSEKLVRSCVKKLNKVKSNLEDKDM